MSKQQYYFSTQTPKSRLRARVRPTPLIRQKPRQLGGGCPSPVRVTMRTRNLISAISDLQSGSGQETLRLLQYISKYGPITLTTAEFPECDMGVIYENGMPIYASSYLQ